METGLIDMRTLLVAAAAIIAVEVVASPVLSAGLYHPMVVLAAARLLEVFLIILAVRVGGKGMASLGLSRSRITSGVKRGLIWSAGLGLAATGAALVLLAFGSHPLPLVRTHIPEGRRELILFFAVGGVLGPVAEELFFRGVLYGFLRRWGAVAALLLSSLIFVLSHPASHGIRITHLVGAVLFGLAYEVERNLLVPITVHILGNLAIFTLSLLPW